jgi:hypothetical protein
LQHLEKGNASLTDITKPKAKWDYIFLKSQQLCMLADSSGCGALEPQHGIMLIVMLVHLFSIQCMTNAMPTN